MQALYSQPHKMMEIKPGVQLSEGGKQYGGLSYNHTRPNQKDLESYKKSKEHSSAEVKQTVEHMKRIKQMQLEEQNSKLNRFFANLASQSNIHVESLPAVPFSEDRKNAAVVPHHYKSTHYF